MAAHLLLLLILAAAPLRSAAQAPPPSPDSGYSYFTTSTGFNPSIVALFIPLAAAFVLIGCLCLYIRRCCGELDATTAGGPRWGAIGGGPLLGVGFGGPDAPDQRRRGLDRAVIATFPTMACAEAKRLRIGKGALECAVCISEFEDDEVLRLLPKCSHVFHPDCIDAWLHAHVTCPVCRCDLSAAIAAGESGVSPATEDLTAAPATVVTTNVHVNVQEEERLELERIGTERRALRSSRRGGEARLARSNSTGHSLALRFDGEHDRFTLRLPESVHREIVAAAAIGGSTRRGRIFGEGSTGGLRSAWAGVSERWPSILPRTASGRFLFRRRDDEGSVRRGDSGAAMRPAKVAAAAQV